MKFSSSPRLRCSCSYFFFLRTYNETPSSKTSALFNHFLLSKNSVVFGCTRARPFPRAVPSFRASSNFGIKKTHSLARTVVVGRLFTMIDITASFWNTLLLRGALRLSRMRFVSFLKRFFSRVASRKLITVGVFFFFSLSFFPNFTKRHTTHFARAKAKDGRRKRPTTKVSYSHSPMIKRNNNGDKNNENARSSSALPYLVVCTKKSCFKFMCTFSRKTRRRSVLWHHQNERIL